MLRYALLSALALILIGCNTATTKSETTASTTTAPAATEQVAAAEPSPDESTASETSSAKSSDDGINIAKITPYSDNAKVAGNIKAECQLGYNLPQYLVGNSMELNLVPKVSSKGKGKNLVLEITDAVSAGNAWIGHRKYVSVKGTLYENGKKHAGFNASRVSMGGAFAGFKSSCSVLNRTIKAIAKDIAIWLIEPVDDVYLGDRL